MDLLKELKNFLKQTEKEIIEYIKERSKLLNIYNNLKPKNILYELSPEGDFENTLREQGYIHGIKETIEKIEKILKDR